MARFKTIGIPKTEVLEISSYKAYTIEVSIVTASFSSSESCCWSCEKGCRKSKWGGGGGGGARKTHSDCTLVPNPIKIRQLELLINHSQLDSDLRGGIIDQSQNRSLPLSINLALIIDQEKVNLTRFSHCINKIETKVNFNLSFIFIKMKFVMKSFNIYND